ncbi:DUF6364 family protein [Niabella drilacis]|nr:DUF6364 family protein [Niabella drilacis]
MKAALNLRFDKDTIEAAKEYAKRRYISLSQIVESYLKKLLCKSGRKEPAPDRWTGIPGRHKGLSDDALTNIPGGSTITRNIYSDALVIPDPVIQRQSYMQAMQFFHLVESAIIKYDTSTATFLTLAFFCEKGKCPFNFSGSPVRPSFVPDY